MKKLFRILTALVLLLSTCSVLASAADESLKITLATDLHFSLSDSTSPITQSTAENPFGHASSNGKMLAESYAVISKLLEEVSANDSEYLILTGDITDNGKAENMKKMAEILSDFEQKTGKTVICSIGNHESYLGGSYAKQVALFKSSYALLGYDKALCVDPDSASYTVDLKGRYRLILIDTNHFSEKRIEWIEQQVKQAENDGRVLIGATHFSLYSHYYVQSIVHDSVMPEEFKLADKFIEWGIRFNFSGHIHEIDTASYSNENGTVYDIASGTPTTYPACYRTAEFNGKSVIINTKHINEIDTSLVPSGMNEEAFELMKNDFRAYCEKMFLSGSYSQLQDYITASYLTYTFGLKAENDAEIIAILNEIEPRLHEAFKMPLYGENSLEQLGKKYGFTLEKSEFDDILSEFCYVYMKHCYGDESIPSYSSLSKLTVNGIGICFSYALQNITKQQYETLLSWALTKISLPESIPDSAVNTAVDLASNELTKTESIRYLVQYIASPVIDNFLQDDDLSDNSVFLSDYGEPEENVATVFEKIVSFFRTLFSYLQRLFSFLGEF